MNECTLNVPRPKMEGYLFVYCRDRPQTRERTVMSQGLLSGPDVAFHSHGIGLMSASDQNAQLFALYFKIKALLKRGFTADTK